MREEQTALLSGVLSTERRRSGNPEGIEPFSPALAMRATQASIATLGERCDEIINPEGVEWCGVDGRG